MAAGEGGAAALPLAAPHPRLGRGVPAVAPPPPLQQGAGHRQDAGAGRVRSRAADDPSGLLRDCTPSPINRLQL